MISRHGYLSSSPCHTRELKKQSTLKKKCYCLRGSTKLSSSFGPWDHLALEIPPDNRHVCTGKFLLSDLKQPAATQRKSLSKCRKKSHGSSLSLGYLSKSCALKDDRYKFRHFSSVSEHIRHYRENKPNSLYEEEAAMQFDNHAEEEVDDV